MSTEPRESYGDVTGEYLATRRDAVAPPPEHELVWVRGSDAIDFLQDIITQEVESRPPGDVARSLLLAPRGKILAVFWILRGAAEVGILAELGSGEVIVSELDRYRIRVDVDLSRDGRDLVEVWGPGAQAVLQAVGIEVRDGWHHSDHQLVASIPLGQLPRYVAVGVTTDQLVGAGARPIGTLAATAVRVEAGEPRMGRDLDTKTIPQESGLVPMSVSLTKGCFVGQELVARIESRGHVNRRLQGISLGANVLPPEGAEIVANGDVVGLLTSVAESLRLQAPIGLGMVRREVDAGSDVIVRWNRGEAPARTLNLPLDDFTDS